MSDFKTEYFVCWKIAWQLHKEFYNIRNDNPAWNRLIDRAEEIMLQYKETRYCEFMKEMTSAIMSELERRSKDDAEEGI